MTKIFCDTANIETIRRCINKYKVDGVTTNPSIMRSDGVKDYKKHCLNILKVSKDKSVSVEVFADKPKEITEQAIKISKFSKKLYVKIPIVNTKGKYLTNCIKDLNSKKIKLNITAVFTFKQLKLIKKVILKNSPVIISIFCGRIADSGKDPELLVKKAVKIFKNKKNVKILWASTREVFNYYQAKRSGCHIITMGPKFVEKLKSKKISFEKYSIETVKQFYKDGKDSNFRI